MDIVYFFKNFLEGMVRGIEGYWGREISMGRFDIAF